MLAVNHLGWYPVPYMPRSPRSKPFDILTIGESLRDIFYLLDEASVSCTLKKEHCQLCLEYAEKIPVKTMVKAKAAGNAANAAVAAARLGFNASTLTWIGHDAEGRDIHATLDAEKVNHDFIQVDPKYPTNEAAILSFQGEKTQLVNFQPRKYKMPTLPESRCIYYSAMGHNFGTFDRELIGHLKKHKVFFAFQPGTTHIRKGLKAVKPFLPFTDLLVLNKDEAHQIFVDGERPILNLLETFHRHGSRMTVITDGKNGAYAFDGQTQWYMPAFPITPKESTGAGDSFASTMTLALLDGQDLPTALRWGSANAASVIQHIGPQAGLLDAAQLKNMMKRFSKIKPTIIV